MPLIIKDLGLKKLDKDIFNANKIYGMALNSLGKLPNLQEVAEFIDLKERLKKRNEKNKKEYEF